MVMKQVNLEVAIEERTFFFPLLLFDAASAFASLLT